MVVLIGCILSFAAGAGCVLYTLSIAHGVQVPEAYSSDLKSQWEEFLNYNGEE